jgi:D-hexose-6-phosphate mutarotase
MLVALRGLLSLYFLLNKLSILARVYLFGATLTSWQVEGTELIFVSPKAVFDNKKAIR